MITKTKIKRVRKTHPIANRTDLPKRTGPDSIYDNTRFPGIALSLLRHTGANDTILGHILGVGPNTIKTWCRKHETFREAVRRGRDDYDTEKVERRMLEKALGYKYENQTYERTLVGYEKNSVGDYIIDEDTKKKIPIFEMVLTKTELKERAPDNVLLIFWLKNRNQERWRDINRKSVEYPDGPPVHNHIEQTLNMFLETATEGQLEALEGLVNQQPLIEVPSANSVSHG